MSQGAPELVLNEPSIHLFGLSRAEFISVLSHMLPIPEPYGAGFWCVGGVETRCCPGILCFHTIVSNHYVTFLHLKVALH